MAFVALLMAYYRQSKRRTADFLGTLLGQSLVRTAWTTSDAGALAFVSRRSP